MAQATSIIDDHIAIAAAVQEAELLKLCDQFHEWYAAANEPDIDDDECAYRCARFNAISDARRSVIRSC